MAVQPTLTAEVLANAAPRIHGLARRLDPERADDATQEALARAWRARRAFRSGTDPLPYLAQILRNTVRDYHRHKSTKLETSYAEVPQLPATQSIEAIAVDHAAISATIVAIRQYVTDEEYHIMLLSAHGVTRADIATRLHLTPGQVNMRLFRARQRVRASMVPIERGDENV